ncbi:extracellular solute-binding protein [Kineococcus aurantiacus]|uniref:Multiple sugar transport system substrate-binding protein n=1 Tax=Kineococcus aurantiacus TaxID=37633 RepID=A0A7Y9DNN5_9ACTN|nr:multiple sugar transport system substrate-binding protein [Kineococcus aurantiacus]
MNSHPPNPSPRGALSRRNLLRGGAAAGGLGLVAATAGCGSPLAAGLAGTPLNPGTVTFWNLFGGGDGARLLLMLDEYRKQQGSPDSLVAATFAWGNPYYTKVSLATLGNKPPDVAVAHLTRASNLAAAGLLEPITDETLALVGLEVEDFTPAAWEAASFEGQSYAIPMDTHPWVLFYGTEVCQQAGLLGADGKLARIQGLEAWEAALTAAKETTGRYGAATASVGDDSNCWRFVNTLYSQREGAAPLMSEEGQEITMDDDLMVDTLGAIQRWTDTGLMPKVVDVPGAELMLSQGETAFFMNGEWEITTLQSIEGLDFSMAAFPQLYEKPAAHADSHAFVLPKMDRDADQLERAMGFVHSMLEQGMTWAEGGHVPTYLPIFDSEEYKTLEPQADYAETATYASYDPAAWYSGSGSNFETVTGSQIGLVMQGLSTPEAAVARIRSQLETYARTANPL